MHKLMNVARRFGRDESGAAMIEYTVLIGIITVAVIVTIGLVGTYVTNEWIALDAALNPPA